MRKHRCPVRGCGIEVDSRMLMCRTHWFRVPKPLRDAVWETWRNGPMLDYIENRKAAIAAATASEPEAQAK